MNYLIKYTLGLSDHIMTCSTEKQALEFAHKVKEMGGKYILIFNVTYNLELTSEI
jgi:hypothetical protein